MKHGDGVFDYRMYEYLCDVVHPAALGYGLLMDDVVDDHGELTVTLTKEKSEPRLADQIVAAATWGACHGIGLIIEAAEQFEKIEPTLSSWADGHVKRQKAILNDLVEKKVH